MVDNDRVAAALPSYEVGSELGRGACGVVLAGQHRQLGRLVAIKQLPRAFGADPAVRARFLAEARVLATLDHPHVVAIYDFVDHEGLCLLVMERLTGGTVWSRFHAGGFTPDVSCAILLAVCSGLQHAHQHGVLHRDVKPENMMFSSTGTLKVTDLGIAKVIGGSSTLATRHGEILGTPAYIAPEQAQGYELTPATDVYAAGTLLYELLAGRLPFPADADPATLLYRHVHEAPPPLIETAHAIPVDLAEVTDRAISKAPGDRFQSAEAFGVAIAECAAKAWGRGWLGRTNVPVSASGPILTAALGEALPGEKSGVAIAVESAQPTNALQEPVAGDFLPIQLLHPEFRTDDGSDEQPEVRSNTGAAPTLPPQSAPLAPVAPSEAASATIADPAGSRNAPSAGGAGNAPPPASMAPKRGKDSGGEQPRSRRGLLTAVVAVVVVAALVGAGLIIAGRNHKSKAIGTTSPTASPGTANGTPITPTNATWTELTNSTARDPQPRMEAGSTVLNAQVWMLGGMTQGQAPTDGVQEFDPGFNQWSPGPPLPNGMKLHHLMAVTYHFASSNQVVVLGGWYPDPSGGDAKANVSKQVWTYNDKKSGWEQLPDMNLARAAGGAAVVNDGDGINDIIVAGGLGTDGTPVTDAELFDGKHWHPIRPLLVSLINHHVVSPNHFAAVSDGHCYYAIGGRGQNEDDSSTSNEFERYCPTKGDNKDTMWQSLKPLPTPLDDPAAAVVGGQIIVAGGEKSGNSSVLPYTNVYVYNIGGSDHKWTQIKPMKNGRHGLALLRPGQARNTVWAIDGATGNGHVGPSNIIEELNW